MDFELTDEQANKFNRALKGEIVDLDDQEQNMFNEILKQRKASDAGRTQTTEPVRGVTLDELVSNTVSPIVPQTEARPPAKPAMSAPSTWDKVKGGVAAGLKALPGAVVKSAIPGGQFLMSDQTAQDIANYDPLRAAVVGSGLQEKLPDFLKYPTEEEYAKQAQIGGQGVVQGLTGGFADELAGIRNVLTDPSLAPEGHGNIDPLANLERSYKEGRNKFRAEDKQAAEENKWLYLAGMLGGGLYSPINKLAPSGPNAFKNAVVGGAKIGGLSALGSSELGENDTFGQDVAQAISDVGLGALGGAGTAAIFHGLGQGATALAKKFNLRGIGGSRKNIGTLVEELKDAEANANYDDAKDALAQIRNLEAQKNTATLNRALNEEAQQASIASKNNLELERQRLIEELRNYTNGIDDEIAAWTRAGKTPDDPIIAQLQKFRDTKTNTVESELNRISEDIRLRNAVTDRQFVDRQALDKHLQELELELKRNMSRATTAGLKDNQTFMRPEELDIKDFKKRRRLSDIDTQDKYLQDALEQLRMIGQEEPGWQQRAGSSDETILPSTLRNLMGQEPTTKIQRRVLGVGPFKTEVEPFTFERWDDTLGDPADIMSKPIGPMVFEEAKFGKDPQAILAAQKQLGQNAKFLQQLANMAAKDEKNSLVANVSKMGWPFSWFTPIIPESATGVPTNIGAGMANTVRTMTDVARSQPAGPISIWDQLRGRMISPDLDKNIEQLSSDVYKENRQRPNYVEKDEE